MVTYLYDVETVASNHKAFVNNGTVMRSADVALLAAGGTYPEPPGITIQ